MVCGFLINLDGFRGLLLAGCLLAGIGLAPVRASVLNKQAGVPPDLPVGLETSRSTSASGLEGVKTEPYQAAVLQINGAISSDSGESVVLDMLTLGSLQPHRISTSTVVTDGVHTFDGVLMRAVLDYVGARGTVVTATALNGYEIDIPVRDFSDFDVLLAWAMDGERLEADDKGPFWIIYPRDQHDVLQDIRYDYRWVWQLKSLRVH